MVLWVMTGVMIMKPMSSFQLPDATSWGGALLLSDLGVIEAQGADAATFLHGQLSQDVLGQSADQARLAAYCSVKGRMMASATVLRPEPERFWLLTDSKVLPGWLKRLSMFVMRAKAKLSDVSGAIQVLGLLGSTVHALMPDTAAPAATDPGTANTVGSHHGGLLVRLPDVQGVARALWVGPSDDAQNLLGTLPQATAEQWAWLDVLSGVPRVEAATIDQFVPQMVNFELVGGVNFKKGCYPGQEVVARSQYRGTLKRRAFVAHAAGPIAAGAEVFSANDPGQPAGMVINAAAMPGGTGWSALIELKLAARESALTATSDGNVALTLAELPYPLLTDGDTA